MKRILALILLLALILPVCAEEDWSLLDVIRYKKDHPEVKLYADTHTAAYNSGTNWLSLHIQHRLFYKYLVQKLLPCLEKYFYPAGAGALPAGSAEKENPGADGEKRPSCGDQPGAEGGV